MSGDLSRHVAPHTPELSDTAFKVHVESLEKAAENLESLADEAARIILQPMDSEFGLGTSGDVVFGRFAAGIEVAAKHRNYFQSAQRATIDLIEKLRNTAAATREMAKKYRDAEEANNADVQDVERMLDGTYGATAPAASTAAPHRLPDEVIEAKARY